MPSLPSRTGACFRRYRRPLLHPRSTTPIRARPMPSGRRSSRCQKSITITRNWSSISHSNTSPSWGRIRTGIWFALYASYMQSDRSVWNLCPCFPICLSDAFVFISLHLYRPRSRHKPGWLAALYACNDCCCITLAELSASYR